MNSMRKYINIVEYASNDFRKTWTDIWNWNDMPDEYRNRLMNNFDDCHTMLDMLTGGNGEYARISYWKQYKTIDITMEDAPSILSLSVSYAFNENIIDFDSIRSNSSTRTMADALKVLRGLIQFCKKLNITQIEIGAVDDGAYQWQRLGFYLKRPGNLVTIKILKNKVRKLNVEDSVKAEYIDIIDNNALSDKLIWVVAELPHGEQILKDSCWKGVLDLTDEKCLSRLRRFVKV